MKNNQRLFISKNQDEVPALTDFCREHNWSLSTRSLIRFEPVQFSIGESFDVVFFASIRAAEFFKNSTPDSNYLLACIGQTTAQKIEKLYQRPVDFIGEKAGDPEEVAYQFQMWLGERTVFFPLSAQSARSIDSYIPEKQCEVQVVYQTLPDCVQLAEQDYYVFTSPTNFTAFLKCNQLPEQSKCIAWGKTTEKSMGKAGIQPVLVLNEATEEELVRGLEQL